MCTGNPGRIRYVSRPRLSAGSSISSALQAKDARKQELRLSGGVPTLPQQSATYSLAISCCGIEDHAQNAPRDPLEEAQRERSQPIHNLFKIPSIERGQHHNYSSWFYRTPRHATYRFKTPGRQRVVLASPVTAGNKFLLLLLLPLQGATAPDPIWHTVLAVSSTVSSGVSNRNLVPNQGISLIDLLDHHLIYLSHSLSQSS